MTALRFINAGDTLQAFDTSRARADERDWQYSVRDRTLRDDQQRQSVDAALREGAGTRLATVEAGEDTAQRPSWRAPVVNRLRGTPGGGERAMHLLEGEEKAQAGARTARRQEAHEERETAYRGLEQFNKAMDNGDIDTARTVNTRFRLGIPDEAFDNHRVTARLRGIATTLHRSGIRGETASEVFRAAIENPDLPVDEAVRRGMAAGAERADRTDMIETEKGWFNLRTRRYETDAEGNNLLPTERRRTHPSRASGAGLRVQRSIELANGTIKLVMSDGSSRLLTDQDGKPDRGSGAARRAQSLVGKMISPTQTLQEREGAVAEGLRISDRIGGEAPPANRFRFDAQGNPVR